ncbi:MAG: hypothetical protein VW405_00175 [Rhodospirillaceae bacterium]
MNYKHGSVNYHRQPSHVVESLRKGQPMEYDAVVVPVRSARCWDLSCRSRWADYLTERSRLWMGQERSGDAWAAQYGSIFAMVAESGLPVYPDGVMRALCDWLGLTYEPWPCTGEDGPAGPVTNGNTKHLRSQTVVMVGPEGRREVPELQVQAMQEKGWWTIDDMPTAQDAPAVAVPMNTKGAN